MGGSPSDRAGIRLDVPIGREKTRDDEFVDFAAGDFRVPKMKFQAHGLLGTQWLLVVLQGIQELFG